MVVVEKLNMAAADLYTDGSLRVTVGRAGIGGWLAHHQKKDAVFMFSTEIPYEAGINGIEYLALIHGIEAALRHGVKALYIYTDSDLIVKQLKGEYNVRSEHIAERYKRAAGLLKNFHFWRVTHVPRERNKRADTLAGNASGRADAIKKYKYLIDGDEYGYIRNTKTKASADSGVSDSEPGRARQGDSSGSGLSDAHSEDSPE